MASISPSTGTWSGSLLPPTKEYFASPGHRAAAAGNPAASSGAKSNDPVGMKVVSLFLFFVVIPGHATELVFTRVRQYHCPSRQQPTWMHGLGIHTHDGGYGFRARSLCSRPGMTMYVC